MKNNYYEWSYSNKEDEYALVVPLGQKTSDAFGIYTKGDRIGVGGNFTRPESLPELDDDEFSLKKPEKSVLITAQRILIENVFYF